MHDFIADVNTSSHNVMMRVLIGPFLALFIFGCSDQMGVQPVEKIELRAPGLDILMDTQGEGNFVFSPRGHHRQSGMFDIGPGGFDSLLIELSPYLRYSGPTAETSRRFLASDCPAQHPYVTDRGIVSVRWIGPSLDQIFIIDLGCDYERHAERNGKLRNIISSLQVPDSTPLP